jgi:hypothetical protein
MKFSKHLMPKYKDNRHARQIKISLNKHFKNTSALNKELAHLIASFSHTANISGGSYLVSADLKFFVVQKLLSNHWCLGWFCPSKLALVNHDVRYVPNLLHRGTIQRKRINHPFTKHPSVNIRKHNYFLQNHAPKPYNSIHMFSEIIGALF